jgi:very-short-patch-repair endonuclease
MPDRYQARELRRNSTPAERTLWQRLRGRKLDGLKFLRQHPLGPFVADFCCRDRRIVVEVDGEVHDGAQQTARDQNRDAYLRSQDYVVLRFSNEQILSDTESVLKQISTAAHTAPPHWLRSRIKDEHAKPSNSPSPGEGGREGAGEGAGG